MLASIAASVLGTDGARKKLSLHKSSIQLSYRSRNSQGADEQNGLSMKLPCIQLARGVPSRPAPGLRLPEVVRKTPLPPIIRTQKPSIKEPTPIHDVKDLWDNKAGWLHTEC